MGYSRVGFEVVGVDIRPQPNYPFAFVQIDALELLTILLADGCFCPDDDPARTIYLTDFLAIHASPPCQAYSKAQRIRNRTHPDLVGPTRELLDATGLPYVIENVPGAPLHNPVVLEGQMFDGLRTQRTRWFETNWPLDVPFMRSPRPAPNAKMGRKPRDHEWLHVVGNMHSPGLARTAMGIDWMTRDELREAIPPVYTELIGAQLMAYLQRKEATV